VRLPGNLLYFFKQRGYNIITGVDISPEQVKLAREVIFQVEEVNALEFLEANLQPFDLIITGLDLIEHFNKDAVLYFFRSLL
jgi:hypothetical protein